MDKSGARRSARAFEHDSKKVKSDALKEEAGEIVKTAIYFWIIKEVRLMPSQLKKLNILKFADGKNKR